LELVRAPAPGIVLARRPLARGRPANAVSAGAPCGIAACGDVRVRACPLVPAQRRGAAHGAPDR